MMFIVVLSIISKQQVKLLIEFVLLKYSVAFIEIKHFDNEQSV